MAHFGRAPFSHSEFCAGQPGHQASHPVCHPGSDGDIPLGFDQIADEVSNEFFFYGSSHPHHHEEMFFPADLFSQNVPDQHLYSHPLVAHGELYPGNPIPHWQQGTVAPMVGFRPSLLPDCRNFSVLDSPLHERELHGRNGASSVSHVERSNTNLEFQIGFDKLDVPSPVFLGSYPSGQKVTEESENGEASVTSISRRCSTGPTHPQGSGHNREAAAWSIQLIEADQGSNENTVGFCNAVEKIRNAYPAFDLKTNTGKIWSITTRFPEHILGGTKFKLSIWTDFSPHPLLLTQHAGCITHDLIVEILGCTNQYPAREECLLSVYGADEFLQNNCTLGSHESLRKASTCIQLCLHHAAHLEHSLARTYSRMNATKALWT